MGLSSSGTWASLWSWYAGFSSRGTRASLWSWYTGFSSRGAWVPEHLGFVVVVLGLVALRHVAS